MTRYFKKFFGFVQLDWPGEVHSEELWRHQVVCVFKMKSKQASPNYLVIKIPQYWFGLRKTAFLETWKHFWSILSLLRFFFAKRGPCLRSGTKTTGANGFYWTRQKGRGSAVSRNGSRLNWNWQKNVKLDLKKTSKCWTSRRIIWWDGVT